MPFSVAYTCILPLSVQNKTQFSRPFGIEATSMLYKCTEFYLSIYSIIFGLYSLTVNFSKLRV